MTEATYQADVVIAGAGLAGMVLAYELLDHGKRVILIDKDTPEKLGGLAKESFGGIMLVGTPQQRNLGVRDTPELAWRDWQSFAKFGEDDVWPRRWARHYCENTIPLIYEFLDKKGVRYLPIPNWPERGIYEPGNTVPRWHIVWGTGYEIIACLHAALERHPQRDRLQILFDREVNGFEELGGRIVGLRGRQMPNGPEFRVTAEHVVVATGGICGGDLSMVRANWYKPWGPPPARLLNGAHPYGDGLLQDRVKDLGGNLTRLEYQWHYAAGVHHPEKRKPNDGLSLVPPRSALWVNALGERIRNPHPIAAYSDTRHLVESVLKQPGQYSWQVMNAKIAAKELAVSGSTHMTAFRNKSKLLLLKSILLGNHELVHRLVKECPGDFVVARTLEELVEGMNTRNLDGLRTDFRTLAREIEDYDRQIDLGPKYFTDDQLRRIMACRAYRGDRIRVCKYQKILDRRAMPLIAIREFILARKSLGGIQTDLECRVLRADGEPIPGLYAVGEAAGFGGGGIHGEGSLEGTFLGSCVLTGRLAGRAIAGA